MQDIIDGFLKFQREAFPQRSALFRELAGSQHPRTLFISCSDSRWCRSWSRSASRATCS